MARAYGPSFEDGAGNPNNTSMHQVHAEAELAAMRSDAARTAMKVGPGTPRRRHPEGAGEARAQVAHWDRPLKMQSTSVVPT